MKKSVRIRKALPGEQPGYYNKTAKFLKKAQMGMEVSSVSRDPERMNLIYQNVYASLRQEMTPDLVYNELVSEYGLDQQTSLNIIKVALDQLQKEGYIDPDVMDQTKQQKEEEPNAQQDQQQADEEQQRASEDAENEELAMSDEGYYDEEEAANNSNSHLETEEDEQQEAFRFGGYRRRQEGGESDEYADYQDASDNGQSGEEAVINQYSNKGQTKMEKPFSLEDLMAVTPGMQGQEAFPDLSYYLGDYRPISDSYQPMEYLPTARRGGQLPKAQDGLGITKPLTMGLDYFRSLNPLTNLSGLRKTVPIFSTIGQGMTKIPYAGKYFAPKLETTFTQNRTELWNVLNGGKPTQGIFSQVGTHAGGADGSLSVDRLLLYQDDVKNIIQNIQSGKSSFTLADIEPKAQFDGLVSGIYPMDAKVFAGTDDNGFQFFELKHTFGPNQQLPFGSTPAKAKEVTLKNRFYFNTDPATGQIQVFDPLGKPLTTGARTKYDITRPIGTTLSRQGKYFTTDSGLLETDTYDKSLTGYEYGYPSKSGEGTWMRRDETNPIYDDEGNVINNEMTTSYFDVDQEPQYSITGRFGTPYPASMQGLVGDTRLGRLREVSDTPPATWDRLGFFGKAGRIGENFLYTGLNNAFRTSAKDVREMSLPVYGYANSAIPGLIDPAKEGSYASDIKNAINYKYRLGLKTTLLGGGLGYLGYKTYDAFANPCQCVNPLEANYMKPDAFGNCPCGTDVGPIRTLDPTGVPNTETIDQRKLTFPDSMQFLIQRGIEPSAENYWRYRDSLNLGRSKRAFSDDFSKGGITKNQFIKRFTAKFQEGGDQQNQTLGQGKRADTLTNDVANKKDIFKSKLKDNSNIALTEEIYKNAQSNPKILNMLMQDGPKKNLAEDSSMGGGMQTAQYGGVTDDSVPSWYTGYKGMMTPREYRKLFKQMQRMIPNGLDISRANMASNFYNKRTMGAPYGDVVTYPEYMNMMNMAQMPLVGPAAFVQNPLGGWGSAIDRNTPVYGMPGSSESQAEDAVIKNNLKGVPFLPELSPDFIDSPLMPEFKGADLPSQLQPEDFYPMAEHGGFVDADAKEPLFKFIYGGTEDEYYEPYGLPMAQDGIEITNKAGENRMVADVMPFDEWAEGERDDFATTHPGVDFDTWKAADESGDDYQKYADFHNKSLQAFQDYGAPANNQTNGNCPAGYQWDGTKCVLIQNKSFNTQQSNCPQGMAWSDTYKSCIPVATKRYNQRMVRNNPGFFNTVLPWNPIAGYAGSWTKQMSLPYYLGSNNPYTGQLTGAPIARYVTKKGILGRPKKWIDIYNTGKGDVSLADIEALIEQNKRGGRRGNDNSGDNKNKKPREERLSKTELIDRELKKDDWNREHWDSHIANHKSNLRNARRTFAFENPEFRRLSDKIVFGAGQPGHMVGSGDNARWEHQGNYYEKTERVREKKKNKESKQLGGTSPSAPMDPNAAFGNQPGLIGNVIQGPNTVWGMQQSFNQANNPAPTSAAVTAYNSNPANFTTTEPTQSGRGLETCTEAQKNDTTSECYCSPKDRKDSKNTRCYNPTLVGVENKRKDMRAVDTEAGLNVFNAGARGIMGVFDRRANAKREKNLMLDTVDPFNLYASATEVDRGDWQDFGSKSGMYRYDQEGQDRSSRATYGQYGGFMQDGGESDSTRNEKLKSLINAWENQSKDMWGKRDLLNPENQGRTMQVGYSNPATYMVYDKDGKLIFSSTNYDAAIKVLKGGSTTNKNFEYGGSFEQDEETYMTPEELEQFLAAGGQVEYL